MTTRRGQQDQLLDRLPPHDIEAEKAIAASLLVASDAIEGVAPILQPADFSRDALG
jgi:replicative DNA helicase